jgi:hypothetical protein
MNIDFKGKTIKLHQLTGAQMAEHISMLRNLQFDDLKRRLVGLPTPLCVAIWQAETARVRAIDLASPEHIRESVTPTGIVYALYIAIREILPDVTLAEVQNALLDDVLRMTAAAMFLLRMEPADVPPAIAVDATSGAAAETPVVAQS